ncbi:anti-repressor SinI family protein [Pseudalkalibacillus sp. R45]
MVKKEGKLDEEWVKLILEAKLQGLSKEEVLAYIKKNQLRATVT